MRSPLIGRLVGRLTRQDGMTLPELLVALALGLGVLLAAAMLQAGASAAYVAQLDALQVDDGGRYALALVGRAVRQSAFVDWEKGAPEEAAPAAIAGLDDRSLPRTSEHISSATGDAVGSSDVLALRHAGAGKGPDGDGSVLDCAGFPVHAEEPGWSIFYVARNSDGVAELRCKYRGGSGNWSADAIVAGVDGFQVLYGLDTDSPRDGIPNRYVNASTIGALDAALPPGSAERNRHTWWKRVASVQVALLLHGERPSRAAWMPAEYLLFGPAYAATHGKGDPGVRLAPAAPARGGPPVRRLFSAVFAVGGMAPPPPPSPPSS